APGEELTRLRTTEDGAVEWCPVVSYRPKRFLAETGSRKIARGTRGRRGRSVCLSVRFCRRMLLLRQFGFDRLSDFFGIRLNLGLKPGDDFAIAANQELLEIPLDVAGELGIGLLRGQVFVERALTLTLHDDF